MTTALIILTRALIQSQDIMLMILRMAISQTKSLSHTIVQIMFILDLDARATPSTTKLLT